MSDLEFIARVQTNFSNLINDLNHIDSDIDHLNFLPMVESSLARFMESQYIICTDTVEDVRTIGWEVFLPDRHFDKKHIIEILELGKIDFFDYCWITRVQPGKMLPPIQDVGKGFDRWHCHITGKILAQVLFVGNTTLYCEYSGNLYKWKDSNLTYAANNIGNEPQYFLNIVKRI